MKPMKLLLFFMAGLACAAELAGVHRVYLMPMSRGMDQYLANRLASEHIFEVVTDPKLADAVFTDHLGEGFETRLEDFSPSPKPPEPVAKTTDDARKQNDAERPGPGNIFETSNKVSNPALNSSFGRAKGTIFLVDAKSRAVVWSAYDPPKDSSGKELDRTANNLVSRLKKDLNPKKKQ